MAFLLALSSAVFYGTADFFGGLATKRHTAIPVVFLSQGVGLLLLLLVLPLFPSAAPTSADIAWGALAGIGGGAGVALLYHGLAVGTMSVVAPTTAVCAVAIPVFISVILGERLGALVELGIGIGIIAIFLVSLQASSTPADATRRKGSGLGIALCSGVLVGIFLYALAQAKATAGLWPLVASRTVSTSLIGVIAAARRASLRMPRPVLVLTLLCGVVDMIANGLYMYAARIGPLSPVVTLSSLYPASTVILASLVLHERLSPWQKTGVALAFVAVVLIVSPG